VVRIDWFAVGVALFAFLLLVGLIVWVVMRERGRRGPSGGGGYRAPEQRAGENQRHDP
jgi:flagellar biogenesis protein FliO